MRLRIRATADPIPAVELTDTPRPSCPSCHGHDPRQRCGCWQPARAWFLLPLPRRASTPCCHLHREGAPCCDPEDCGPCCEDCPSCPRTTRKATAR